MNAFRGRLLASGASLLCSNSFMDRFANWAGQSDGASTQQQPQNAPQQNQPNGGNPPNNQTNQQTNPQNNGGTNDDLISTIWDEQTQQPGNTANQTGNQPGQTAQQPGNTPAQRTDEQIRGEISQHLQSVGLGDFALSAADVEKLTSGENTHQEFANLVNTRIQQSYLQAVQSSQKLIEKILEQRIPKAVEDAVNQSKAFFNGNDLRRHLKNEIPYADDPAIGPMAETVFRQFLVKGANKEKATELTKQYFERVRQAMDPNYVPPNPNTRTTFRGHPRQAMNFVDVLKGN